MMVILSLALFLPVFAGMPAHPGFSISSLNRRIKRRVKCIKVFAVQIILYNSQCFTEPLEVYDFPRPQEADRVRDIRGIDGKAQDIVIRCSCFLFCSHIFRKVGDRIADRLEHVCGKCRAGCCLRPQSERVIDVIVLETACFQLFHGHVSRELVDDRCDHLEMPELFGTDVR